MYSLCQETKIYSVVVENKLEKKLKLHPFQCMSAISSKSEYDLSNLGSIEKLPGEAVNRGLKHI